MAHTLEVQMSKEGGLMLPPEALEAFEPEGRFEVEQRPDGIFLRAKANEKNDIAAISDEIWFSRTPAERAEAFRAFVRDFSCSVDLPDEAYSRDSMYD